MKILIANATLASRTGTETYVRDLAIGLLRRGHAPIVYAPEVGEIARELRSATVPVVDDLRQVGTTPDVIHGNHNTELMSALLHFPNVPAVFYCHSWLDWISVPPVHPRVLAYVAVDETCRDRLLYEHAVPEHRLRVSLNSVDLDRFQPRGALPEKPQRALVFSNDACQWTHLPVVKEASARAGIAFDVIGAGVKAENSQPETVLRQYDLVFAKARCALEALAVGCAVILCDARGSGPIVTTENLERLRSLNFGIRAQAEPLTVEVLLREIARYDPKDAGQVSLRVRADCGLETSIDDALAAYDQAVTDFRNVPSSDPAEEGRAAANYLRWLTLTARSNERALQSMLTNSSTLRFRNAIGRVSLLDRLLKSVGHLTARRTGGNNNNHV